MATFPPTPLRRRLRHQLVRWTGTTGHRVLAGGMRLAPQYSPRPLTVRAPRVASHASDTTIGLVTPSYQSGAWIAAAMDSVLDQVGVSCEYRVHDGGSDDETVEQIRARESHLRDWCSAPDGGQAAALHEGLNQLRTDVMGWLNADDLLLPGALAVVRDFFDRHPDIDVVYGHRVMIDDLGRDVGRWVVPPDVHRYLPWVDYIPQETLFWRRRVWERAGAKIDAGFRFAMDWELLLRFQQFGARFHRIPAFLGAFRLHDSQKSQAWLETHGVREMRRLRIRSLGHDVDEESITDRLTAFRVRQCLCYWGHRAGVLRYGTSA